MQHNKFDIYMPYHLLVEPDLQIMPADSNYDISKPFKTAGSLQDFYTFYDSIDTYDFVQAEDLLIVKDTYKNTTIYLTFTSEKPQYSREIITYVSFSIRE